MMLSILPLKGKGLVELALRIYFFFFVSFLFVNNLVVLNARAVCVFICIG